MFWPDLTQPQAALYAAALGATGAIAGGMIAAVLTQLLGGRAQRRRQWDEIRHVAYARVTEAFHTAWGLYDQNGVLRAEPGVQRRAAGDLLAAYARAALLTRTDGAAEALERLHSVAQDLWDRGGRSWPSVEEACRGAEWRFRRAARAELGLSRRRGAPALPADPSPASAAPAASSPASAAASSSAASGAGGSAAG